MSRATFFVVVSVRLHDDGVKVQIHEQMEIWNSGILMVNYQVNKADFPSTNPGGDASIQTLLCSKTKMILSLIMLPSPQITEELEPFSFILSQDDSAMMSHEKCS